MQLDAHTRQRIAGGSWPALALMVVLVQSFGLHLHLGHVQHGDPGEHAHPTGAHLHTAFADCFADDQHPHVCADHPAWQCAATARLDDSDDGAIAAAEPRFRAPALRAPPSGHGRDSAPPGSPPRLSPPLRAPPQTTSV